VWNGSSTVKRTGREVPIELRVRSSGLAHIFINLYYLNKYYLNIFLVRRSPCGVPAEYHCSPTETVQGLPEEYPFKEGLYRDSIGTP
jgi:hypothetical protein